MPGVRLKIGTDYTGLGKIQYLLAQREISILDTVYTDRVEILTAAAADMAESLKKEITEGTSGAGRHRRRRAVLAGDHRKTACITGKERCMFPVMQAVLLYSDILFMRIPVRSVRMNHPFSCIQR